jgi:hypothetical protein
MFLPYETSFSMWFAPTVRYEWVPVDPPAPEPGVACGEGVQPQSNTESAPRLRPVFAGIDWAGYSVWRAQANPAWDVCAHNCQHEADGRGQERARHAKRETPPIGNTPSWDAPQSPDALPAAKLDYNKGT